MNRVPAIIPRSSEPWSQDNQPYRVEYLNREIGNRCVTYFGQSVAALEFAAEHQLFGQPAVVQSRDMTVTHVLKHVAVTDPRLVFSEHRFGDYATAREEFERCKAHAEKHGGAYRLFEVGSVKPIAQFIQSAEDL